MMDEILWHSTYCLLEHSEQLEGVEVIATGYSDGTVTVDIQEPGDHVHAVFIGGKQDAADFLLNVVGEKCLEVDSKETYDFMLDVLRD